MALSNSSIQDMNQYLNSTYYVPDYQREYSWELEQLDDFWTDLNLSSDKNVVDHFFGQIVIHKDVTSEEKRYIIDGQQRTTTAIIFLSVLRTWFRDIHNLNNDILNAEYWADDITSKYIGRRGSLHLTLGAINKDYFEKNIQLGIPSHDTKEKKVSNDNIRKAYWFFDTKIKEALSDASDSYDKYERLNLLYETFIKKFKVLYMEATDLNEAFVIFETLNARGKNLETSDLLKNYILRNTDNSNNSLKKWNNMISNLNENDPTKYIRYFWNSRNSFIREKDLYKAICKNINHNKSNKFLDDLELYSSCYSDISNPADCNYFTDKELIESLKALKTMKASTFCPLILALIQANYGDKDILLVLKRIETFVFRNFTICNRVANSSETFFSKLAYKVSSSQISSIDEICKDIKEATASDEEFKSSFALWEAPKSNKELIRYILRKIHYKLDPDPSQEINTITSDVQIEHIMPVDNKIWNVDQAFHDEYLWKLGNLALLGQKLNAKAKAKAFSDKKEFYKDSKIYPNNELCNYDNWTKIEIEERQNKFADLALEIWGI